MAIAIGWKPQHADFEVEDHGSIVMFSLCSEAAREFFRDHVETEPFQWFGGRIAIEKRCVEDLLQGFFSYMEGDPSEQN